MRELLATHAFKELPRLLEADSMRPDAQRVAARFPRGIPPWEPVLMQDGKVVLRCDPFGYSFLKTNGVVLSQGLEQRKFLKRSISSRQAVEAEARKRGRPPHDLAEVQAWGLGLSEPPYGGRWDFSADLPDVVWTNPSEAPWKLR